MTTWNSAFEATPAISDAADGGPARINEEKKETRFRSEVEHNFGPNGTDDGTHRPGSAVVFSDVTTPPANLQQALYAGSGASGGGGSALTDGRLWCDFGSDYPLYVYDSGAPGWVQITAQPHNAFTTLYAIGTNTSADQAFSTGAPGAITLSGANPAVAVPAAGAYIIRVTGTIFIANADTTNGRSVYVGIKENGTVVDTYKAMLYPTTGTSFTFSYINAAPTLSTTYTYSLEQEASGANVVYNPHNPGGNFGTLYSSLGSTACTTKLVVTLNSTKEPS